VSSSRLTLDQQLDAITTDGDRFWDAIDAAPDPQARVPSCPEWTIEDLGGHLLGVHAAWTEMVEHPAEDPTRAFELEVASQGQAAGKDALVQLGRDTHRRMLDVFGSADQQQPTWTWAEQQDVAFITRHQVQEAAVHRWDAQNAAGFAVDPIDPEVAADSIDEFLTLSRPALTRGGSPMPGSVHLHCTDVDGEWFVHPDGRVEPIHAKGDVALRGTASDLLLALYTRVPLDDLDVIGDRSVAESFLSVHLE
jgi:uncharacterized protein (TIGR03083 family)